MTAEEQRAALEHMQMRWQVSRNKNGQFVIVTEDGMFEWGICTIAGFLPGDDSGELTAQAIVDLHNQSLGEVGSLGIRHSDTNEPHNPWSMDK